MTDTKAPKPQTATALAMYDAKAAGDKQEMTKKGRKVLAQPDKLDGLLQGVRPMDDRDPTGLGKRRFGDLGQLGTREGTLTLLTQLQNNLRLTLR